MTEEEQALQLDKIPSRFHVLADGDNLVLQDSTTVLKVSKSGGPARLKNGLRSAIVFGQRGVPCVQPIYPALKETELGPTTFWPRVFHHSLTSKTMDVETSDSLGKVLAKVSNLPRNDDLSWGGATVDMGSQSRRGLWGTEAQHVELSIQLGKAVQWVRLSGALVDWRMSHGDITLSNVLVTGSGIQLIDLDSAGMAPMGWDLACVLAELKLEGNNNAAAEALINGYRSRGHLPTPGVLSALQGLRLVTRTLSLLKQDPVEGLKEVFEARLDQLSVSLRTRTLPEFVTPLH